MKCLKNSKTGNIIRIDDKQAYNMVGSQWTYVSKSEWKTATRKPKQSEVANDQVTDAVTTSSKKKNSKQFDGVKSEEPFVKTRKKSK